MYVNAFLIAWRTFITKATGVAPTSSKSFPEWKSLDHLVNYISFLYAYNGLLIAAEAIIPKTEFPNPQLTQVFQNL